jgi:hypothetical protein
MLMCVVAKFDHMRRAFSVSFLFLLSFSCGGIVEEAPEDGTPTSSHLPGSGGQATASEGSPDTKEKKRLGDCHPGVDRNKAQECPWIADGICYPSWDAACNCVCPTSGSKVFCTSDFPGGDGSPTEVHCY